MLPENVPMSVETDAGSNMTVAQAEGARDIRQADIKAITKVRNVMVAPAKKGGFGAKILKSTSPL
jgi:hypothetical protein